MKRPADGRIELENSGTQAEEVLFPVLDGPGQTRQEGRERLGAGGQDRAWVRGRGVGKRIVHGVVNPWQWGVLVTPRIMVMFVHLGFSQYGEFLGRKDLGGVQDHDEFFVLFAHGLDEVGPDEKDPTNQESYSGRHLWFW